MMILILRPCSAIAHKAYMVRKAWGPENQDCSEEGTRVAPLFYCVLCAYAHVAIVEGPPKRKACSDVVID